MLAARAAESTCDSAGKSLECEWLSDVLGPVHPSRLIQAHQSGADLNYPETLLSHNVSRANRSQINKTAKKRSRPAAHGRGP